MTTAARPLELELNLELALVLALEVEVDVENTYVPNSPKTGSKSPRSPASPGGDRDAVGRVFVAWQISTGRSRTRLDDKRSRLIRAALKAYSEADVIAAVEGWAQSAHHRGENGSGTRYNELGLLLRDAAHIEQFRDLRLGENQPAVAPRRLRNGERYLAEQIAQEGRS